MLSTSPWIVPVAELVEHAAGQGQRARGQDERAAVHIGGAARLVVRHARDGRRACRDIQRGPRDRHRAGAGDAHAGTHGVRPRVEVDCGARGDGGRPRERPAAVELERAAVDGDAPGVVEGDAGADDAGAGGPGLGQRPLVGEDAAAGAREA